MTSGSISQQALDRFIPTLGSGLAVIETMLIALRDLDVRYQLYWNLAQYALNRGDGKQVKLYGALLDMGVTDRKRPQYLALQLANQDITGDLVGTRQSGENPVWVQPALNGVAKTTAHSIESFAFVSQSKRSLILMNLDLNESLNVSFLGKNSPAGAVEVERLQAASIASNNEKSDDVIITKQLLKNFDRSATFKLPPHSMTTLSWSQATTR